jgi:hypothetical protein
VQNKFLPEENILLTSCLCTEQRLRSASFQNWTVALRDRPGTMHRKAWEWGFICEGLRERGLLASGKRGLGFAVGEEPLSSLFASRGIDVVATDLALDEAIRTGWANSQQHARERSMLNERKICDRRYIQRAPAFPILHITVEELSKRHLSPPEQHFH